MYATSLYKILSQIVVLSQYMKNYRIEVYQIQIPITRSLCV